MGRPRVLSALALAVVALASSSAVRAAEPNLGTLSDRDGAVTWSGSIDGPTLAPGDPGQCGGAALAAYLGVQRRLCDRFTLFLDLPVTTWGAGPGSVEFAIRWDDLNSTERDLDLYVLDAAGSVVGKSAGQDSEAEVAFVHAPANGLYDAVVVAVSSAQPIDAPHPIDYEGRIEVEADPVLDPPDTGHALLPDLIAMQPRTVAVASGEYLVSLAHNRAVSCYPEETLDTTKGSEGPAIRCLRFDQIVANLGEGRLEIRFDPSSDAAPVMWQRIYSSDGSSGDRRAGIGEFHAVHGHWHYTGFGYAELYDTAGNLVRQGRKRGFCLIDVLFEMWGQKGNDPRRTSFPGCQLPGDDGWVVEGIDVGWADNYNWFLADQYLNITGVENGRIYRLDVVANPNALAGDAGNGLAESDYSNNVSHTWICLQASGASVVGGPDAGCAAG